MKDNKTILVVDDDSSILAITTLVLERAGYTVITASSGKECLEKARRERPALVLLDVMLGDENGVDVCKRLKEDASLGDTFVVLISSVRTQSQDQAEAISLGADGYIARPVGNKELVARIGMMMRLREVQNELRQQTDTARANDALLLAILQTFPDLVLVLDEEGRYLEILTGDPSLIFLSAPEQKGRLLHEVLPRELADLTLESIRRSIESGEQDAITYTLMIRGEERFFDGRTVALDLESDGKQMVIFVAREISEEKLIENDRAELIARLEESNQDLERFAYVASHDLQEPLRMVTSYLDLLQQRMAETLESESREFLEYALDGATHMQSLIRSLLEYSRVQTQEVAHSSVDSQKVLDQVLQNLQISITENKATVTAEELPVVVGDETQIEQLFQNLISNAIRFRRSEPPQISIGAEPEGQMWRFWVRDNGIGIAAEDHEDIFAIFHRLHNDGGCAGSGMGLTISKRIVERHGGDIWVESQVGQGTTFYFTLPAQETEEDGPTKPTAAQSGAELSSRERE